jgi:hypothetical protein
LIYRVPDADYVHPHSILYGPAGAHFARCLVASSLADSETARRARERFLAFAPRAAAAGLDFISGASGTLTAASLLARRLDDARVGTVADEIANRILTDLRKGLRTPPEPWTFAVGWPGVLFSLLEWSRMRRVDPPPIVLDRLRRFATSRAPSDQPWATVSWCRGAAGHVVLWCSAYELTGETGFRTLARKAARRVSAYTGHASSNLCCGRVGWIYAFLNLEAVDPGHGWRKRALIEANRLIRQGPAFTHPSGLFRGFPGLLCAAVDLLAPPARVFPSLADVPSEAD